MARKPLAPALIILLTSVTFGCDSPDSSKGKKVADWHLEWTLNDASEEGFVNIAEDYARREGLKYIGPKAFPVNDKREYSIVVFSRDGTHIWAYTRRGGAGIFLYCADDDEKSRARTGDKSDSYGIIEGYMNMNGLSDYRLSKMRHGDWFLTKNTSVPKCRE